MDQITMLVDTNKNSHPESEMVNNGSIISMGWAVIEDVDLPSWSEKLLSTDAHYRQYPYWCEPYQDAGGFKPKYYSYRTPHGDAAYVCVLERNFAGIKFGLVFRGPVAVGAHTVSDQIINDLCAVAKKNGYAFLRFTHRNEDFIDSLLRLPESRQVESFPFDRDPPKSLIVTFAETDEETFNSFQPVGRRSIRVAEKAGFVISKSDSVEDYRKIWPMLERLSERKSFALSNRNLDAWIQIIENARNQNCSMLYTASLDGVCVSAIHLLRYGQTVEFMLGALDVGLLGKNPSPSALLHWHAMRDFYNAGCKYYNLGGPGDGVRNKVYQFKRKFHPELKQSPPAVTVVLDPFKYRCWDLAVLKGWLGSKRQIERVQAKSKQIFQRTFSKKTNAI
ncbi:MAG: lipid II:glycine glycyltransferase FemX [Pyrinomonadaceae bacterium]